ncbi:Short chain dehydrogenase sol3 [Psilocybe cubensis]|uniref:NAD(P)-binding protein n=2 Tax=Psilocybe cubensis TaxID=181762 RepID=A0A8H7XSJ2_PSICU|nr:Short chain dehydrogenase sol3 [Psilocybe cubensis]KAH9479749.1 Short chain dehydrogenase sol3 [Psilocybe cubensis]
MGQLTPFGFFKDQWTTVPPVVKVDLTGKTAIVTGANSGIGLETAKHLARMNPGRLIITCRSKEKGEEAAKQIMQATGYTAIEAWILDLVDFSSVKAFAERYDQEGGRLDIVIQNAAVAYPGEEQYTEDGWELSTKVNNLSTSLLTLLLLPRMLDTAQRYNTTPRIVIAASETHFWVELDKDVINSPNFFRTYAHKEISTPCAFVANERYRGTKLLNILFARALNDRLHRKPIIVNAPNPGFCASGILRNYNTLPLRIRTWFMELLLARTPEQGSRQFVWAAIGGEEKKDELRGTYISLAQVSEPSDYILSEEGKFAQDKIWADLIAELTRIDTRIQNIAQDCLTIPAPVV